MWLAKPLVGNVIIDNSIGKPIFPGDKPTGKAGAVVWRRRVKTTIDQQWRVHLRGSILSGCVSQGLGFRCAINLVPLPYGVGLHQRMRVLHSGSALAFQARGAGSIPATRSRSPQGAKRSDWLFLLTR